MPVASPPSLRKKLIEVSIPLEAINAASKKQKAPKGYPTAIHKYWAQRPISACRAVLFAQLVDDPSAWPERFPSKEEQDNERKRLHEIIVKIVPWEASDDDAILTETRWEIARSVAWGLGEEPPERDQSDAISAYLQAKAPPVYDPFSGGGSIPLEAQRLGLRAYGSDLNPVAVLIGKALVEIPPKFAGRPPINPDAPAEKRLVVRTWKGAQGLAEDVRWYGRWLKEEAERRIGHLFPTVAQPNGSQVRVIAWLWARTVPSPDPAAKGARVPLVSSWMLCTKAGCKAWVEPVLDPTAPDGYRFEVHSGPLEKIDEERLKRGVKTGRGANFSCLLSGSPIAGAHIKSEGVAGRMGARLLAIVAEGKRGRIFVAPTLAHELAAAAAEPKWCPDADLPNDPRNFWTVNYGLTTFASLFTSRQLTALTTFTDLIEEARSKALTDARDRGLTDDLPLREGGAGARAYADAVATYLAFGVSRAADYGSAISTWLTDDNAIRSTFGRQALPMTWDFCEGNFFGDSSAALTTIFRTIPDVIAHQLSTGFGLISQIDATKNGYLQRPCIVNTDPPYYDNVAYADLSDFFYVWLRKSLSNVWPDITRRLVTPKDGELVATPYRHGGKSQAEAFFMEGMGRTFKAMLAAARDDHPVIIYYAFKQSEVDDDGVTSAGWATFLHGVVSAGFVVDGTWPLRTESGGRLVGKGANALASSVVLVCRKRSEAASTITRAELLRELRRDLPSAMNEIIAARVGPVDFEQAVIGPGMGVFSSYAKVLEEDDSPMTVRTALALINRVRLEVDAQTGNFDPETHVALAWFHAHGDAEKPSGEAILLANAKGVFLEALFAAGIFRDGQGKVRLVRRDGLPKSWSPATDPAATIWECVHHTARALDEGGTKAAAALIKAMGPKAEEALSLAYRLYDIANARGEVGEARVYAELAAEWPEIEALAATLDDNVISKSAPAQPSLFT